MAEPQDHVLEMLKKMRRENTARFNAIARDMSAIHHRLDLIAAARDDIAAAGHSLDTAKDWSERMAGLKPDRPLVPRQG